MSVTCFKMGCMSQNKRMFFKRAHLLISPFHIHTIKYIFCRYCRYAIWTSAAVIEEATQDKHGQ